MTWKKQSDMVLVEAVFWDDKFRQANPQHKCNTRIDYADHWVCDCMVKHRDGKMRNIMNIILLDSPFVPNDQIDYVKRILTKEVREAKR